MARNESDREDLMAEATGLTRRAELLVQGSPEPIVLGFREATGWFSIYFGQDPVYTFNADGALRRSYAGGFLFRTQGTTLARLERVRTQHETVLQRTDLAARERDEFLTRMQDQLRTLRGHLDAGDVALLQCVGPPQWQSGWKTELRATLEAIVRQPRLAPAMPGKR